MSHPLDGVKVLDLGVVGIGPIAASLLGTLGAQSIRVERPQGDPLMTIATQSGGMGTHYPAANFNKKANIILNLKTELGKQMGHGLLKWADVVIENHVPGVMENLGFGYEAASEINSRIVYVASSPWGTEGPWVSYGGADNFFQVSSGFASLNGKQGGPAELFRYIAHVDWTTSIGICQAILLGLLARDLTGEGQKIDTSGFQAGIVLQTSRIAEYFATGENPKRMGSSDSRLVPSQSFKTQDNKYINVSVSREEYWPGFCKALEIEPLEKDLKFASNQQRVIHRDELLVILNNIFNDKPLRWWLVILQRYNVPCGLCYDFDGVVRDPHVQENNWVVETHTPWSTIKTGGIPWQFNKTPTCDYKPIMRPEEIKNMQQLEQILAE